MNTPKKHLTREYGMLRRNLAYIHTIDKKVREWIEDDKVPVSGGESWLALLGGVNHDLAEETLVKWLEDKSVPAHLRANAYLHLLTPRKRMDKTIEKLFQLANKKHENQDAANMILGSMLRRY